MNPTHPARWWTDKGETLVLGAAHFESRPYHGLSWPRLFVALLSSSRRIPGHHSHDAKTAPIILLTQRDTATYRLRYSEPYNRHISRECNYKSSVTNPTTSKLGKTLQNDTVPLRLTGEWLLLYNYTLRRVLSRVPHSSNIMWRRWGEQYSHYCCFTHGPRAPVCR
jgi:hypothetical protein